jgi:diguanylate cyclase (GGDEF)-like protein
MLNRDAALALLAIAIAAIVGLYLRLWSKLRQYSRAWGPGPARSVRCQPPDSGLAMIGAVAGLAVSSQSAESVASGILDEMHKHRPFDRITVSVIDAARHEIVVSAHAGSEDLPLPPQPTQAVGMQGAAFPWAMKEQLTSSRAGAALSFPLKYGETLLGVLKIEARSCRFSPIDEQIARICGALLASGLQNALLVRQCQQHSITDDLTGSRTRQYFLDALQREWILSSRNGRPFSVVMLSLCGLHIVEVVLEPLERNLVVARVGRLLEQKCRRSNLVARYEDDVFALLMPETRTEQAQALAERLRLWLESDPVLQKRGITGSFGVASYPLDGNTVDELLNSARPQNSAANTIRVPTLR